MYRIGPFIILILFLLPVSLTQTDETEALFQAVPFSQWIKEGPKEELPWRTRISSAKLSLHQRILVHFQIELDGNELLKRCCGGRTVGLLQISDSQGQTYRNYAVQDMKQLQSGLSQYILSFSWNAFALPGNYQVAIALYSTEKEGHNFAIENLHVSPLKNDPLPEAWRYLPNVEFCDPQPEGVDEFLLPRVEGRLSLSIKNRRAIRIEVLGNLTPYVTEQRSPMRYREKLSIFLPILKTLSQINLSNGSVNLATWDFTRSRITFEERDIQNGHLDFARLRAALAANATTKVDVHDIKDSQHYAKFFIQEITNRVGAESQTNGTKDNSIPVLIILSGGMQVGSGLPLLAVSPPPGGNFAVFYLRWEFSPLAVHHRDTSTSLSYPLRGIDPLQAEQSDDGIGKALKNLKPRIFPVNSAEGARKAIASIISELSQM